MAGIQSTLATLSTLALALSPVHSQAKDLYDMSLKELMQLNVQVASKRDESIQNAPGIITVINSSELKKFGGRNLHDVMRLIPAVQQVYPQFVHRNSVAIRGLTTPSLDKYFLILLNGKPMRDPIFYGVNAPLYEGIPLELIDRLEIIRGPGSVIYGSNAFSGVMDIITKDPDNYPENVIQSRIGSFGTHINEALYNTHFADKKGSLVAAIRTNDSDGWELRFKDTSGIEDSFNNENHAWSGFLELNYSDFSMSIFKADVSEKQTLSNGLIADATQRKSDRDFFALEYNHALNESWQAKLDFSSNSSNIAASQEYDARDTSLEFMTHGQVNQFNIDVGIRYRRNTLIDPDQVKVSEVNYQSAFFQLGSQLSKVHKLVTGLQIINPDTSDIQYAPRISLLSQFNNYLNSKLMYSRAYSTPTGVEFSIHLPNPSGSGPDLFIGNPNLIPTTLDNYDLQFSYTDTNSFAAINFFYAEENHGIALSEVNQGQPFPKVYENTASEEHRGIELEGKLDFNNHIHFNASYSYQTSVDNEGKTDNKLLSNHLFKTGVIYDNLSDLTFSIFNVHHSKPSNRKPVANNYNEKEKAYSHLTFNMNYSLSNFIGNTQLDLNFFIDNALNNKAIMMPDPILTGVNTQPKVAERSYYAGLTLLF